MQSRGRRLAGVLVLAVVTALGSATVLAVADSTEPVAPADPAPAETAPATDPPVIEATDPSEPTATEPEPEAVTTTVAPGRPDDTSVGADAPDNAAPDPTDAPPPSSEPTASTVEPDCTGTVDGDGPVLLADGCDPPAPPAVAANPTLAPACGLSATIVVDRSASIEAGAAHAAVAAIVDGLVDTGSTVTLIDVADDASVHISGGELTNASRGSFDGYSPAIGGRSNLGAGLARAQPTDLTIVITDGVVNAGGAAPTDALASAAQQANQLKGAGSHVFAIGVGAVDTAGLAAISGGGEGTDAGRSGYIVGSLAAVTDSLNALATAGCVTVAAAADDLLITPMALVDEGNPGAIAIPATGSADQIGPASPYPSSITVSGETGLVTGVVVHLTGVTHGTAQDIDMLLVGPSGQNLIVMSDVGGAATLTYFTNANVTIDDSGGTPPSSGQVTGSVTWRPTNNAFGSADSFPGPAPTPSGNTTLAGAFAGTNPNGTWSLYIVDDATGDVGSISGGWSLTITTEEAAVATTTTVTSSANPSLVGGSVTFTATVRDGATPVTAGTVTFTDGSNPLGSPVALNGSGQAAFTTAALAEGTHSIRATYSGATGFLTSNGTVSQVVDMPTTTPAAGQFCNTGAIAGPGTGTAFGGPATPYPSRVTVSGLGSVTTLVTVQLGSVNHTAPIDFDILLVSPSGRNLMLLSDVGGQTASTGATLTFADSAGGTIPLAGPLTSGTYRPTDSDADSADAALPAPAPVPAAATTLATFNTFDPNGVWQLFVVDDATGDGGAISGGWCLTISTAAATTTTLTSSANPSTFGQPVTLTATVTAGANPATAGTVTFHDGATSLGSGTVDSSGQATLTTSALAVGTHSLTADYAGTSVFQASSDALSQVVTQAPTATTLTSSLNPAVVGQSVTLTATVTSGGNPVTTGTVTFADGASPLGMVSVDASGQATFTTAALTTGTHTITATYGATTTLATSQDSLDQVIEPATSGTDVTSSVNPSTFGEAVTFTATVTITDGPDAGAPATGTVTFGDGGTAIGAPVPLDSNGQASLTTTGLSTGVHAISADYNGTAAVGASSDSVDQVVGRANSTTTLTSSANPSVFGSPVTLTATVAVTSGPAGGTPAAGVVTFNDGTTGTSLGTVTLVGGQAAVTTSALEVGTHSISASYDGTTGVATSGDVLDQVIDGVADAGGPYAIDEGEPLTLDGSRSLAGPGAIHSWDVNGDGTFGDVTGATPTLTWAQLEALGITDGDGTVRAVRLRLTDGPTFTAITSLTIANVAPTATLLTNDGPVAEGSSTTVTVDGADDPSADDAAALVYRFDFGDDATVDVESPDPTVTVPASFLPNGPGTLVVSAVVVDPDGGASTPLTTTIAITNAPASAYINGPSTAVVGQPVTIKVGAEDPSPVDMAGTFQFTVDWGDGTAPVTLPGPADPPVTHTYTSAGTFTVVATVVDPDGGVSAPLEFAMTVTEQVTPSTTSTTAPASTTTTTEPSSTTTSTVPGGTTTTVPGALPATGASSTALLLVALALLGAGAATVIATRTVRAAASGPSGNQPGH